MRAGKQGEAATLQLSGQGGRGQGPDRGRPWAFLKAGQIRDVLFNKKPH